MEAQHFQDLLFLLKSPSVQVVDGLFVTSFDQRNQPLSLQFLQETASILTISPEDSERLITAIKALLKSSMYGLLTAEQIVELFPSNFNQKLKGLITKIITARLPRWRRDVILSHQFLPRLESMTWRVDIKSASNHISQMGVPTVIVQLKVRDVPQKLGSEESSRIISFELDSGTLQTVLDGLGKIRDQLQLVAGR